MGSDGLGAPATLGADQGRRSTVGERGREEGREIERKEGEGGRVREHERSGGTAR